MELTVHVPGFGQMFGVPTAVVDQYIKLATPSQLKVLLYLLRHNQRSIEPLEIASALSISEELVEEAILFWTQTDLFAAAPIMQKQAEAPAPTIPDQNTASPSDAPAPPEPKKPVTSARTALLPSSKSGELSPSEIAAAVDGSNDLKTLFRMSEQQLGRPLRHVEQKSLVWMHDYNNIGSDIILTVLLYCKSIDRPSVSYAETIVTAWWNDGIQTLSQVSEAIREAEHRRSFTGHIQKAFEMSRKPTPKQQEFIDKWQDQNIPMELITYAYEKTIEHIDKLSFPYLDSILSQWIDAGYRTRTDVDTKDRAASSGKEANTSRKQNAPKSENAEAYRSFIYNMDES